MEPLTLGFPAAVLMGLAFGAGPCAIACLPYLGPVLAAHGGGVRTAAATVLPFSLGRLFGYSVVGAVAGGLGQGAVSWLEGGPAVWALGLVTAGMGALLMFRARRPPQGCTATRRAVPVHWLSRRDRRTFPTGLFALGGAMALNPCLPLGTLLLAAAFTADPFAGLLLGLGFGLGAVVVPGLLFGLALAHFGAQIHAHLAPWRPALEFGAGGLLLTLGGATAMGWVHP